MIRSSRSRVVLCIDKFTIRVSARRGFDWFNTLNDLLNPEVERQNIMYIGSKEKRGAISRRTVLKGGALVATAVAFDRLGWTSGNEQPSIPQVRLANDVMMPMLGFGTYGLQGDVCTARRRRHHCWLSTDRHRQGVSE
jgi:hypothetical protein